MNRLPTAKRATILSMLVEGSSMRAVERITGVSINTITKLLIAAGEACSAYHNEHVHGITSKRLQLDEIWQVLLCKGEERVHGQECPRGRR